ncbi:MAG TPA: ABC transporter permease [Burkholderiales bacterium]|jgi:cell division transport system permease protein|nr:ABC transporter permease [Usitatibacter sp.]HEX5476723.1 ABC transporter permease [Burkholderiales bacterium]
MRLLRLHLHALGAALERIAAQPVASLFSILVLGAAIALPVVAAVVLQSAMATGAGFDTEPHVSVYLSLDASAEDAKRVEQAIRGEPDVMAVTYVPRAQALAELQASTHLAEVLAALDTNPLPDAFTVRMRSTDPASLAKVRTAWAALPKVDQVAADFEWSERLARWARLGEHLVGGAGLLLAAAVVFIVAHLVRLQVLTRREEIEVSQLIGATSADVRRPFLYHGALQGLLAGALAVALAAAFAAWARHELLALTPNYAAELKVVFLRPAESALLVAATGLLGLLAAWGAVSHQLRRFARDR